MKTCHGLFRAAILVIFSAAVLLLLSAGGGAVGQANDREPTHKNKTVREWLEDLTSKDPNAVLQARTALRAMGKSAIPVLVVTAQDKKSPLRLQALSALAQEGSNASATLRDLMELLKDEELAIRLRTAHVLNQLGPMAKYSLGLAAKSPDSKVRQAANLALLKPTAELVPPLIQALKDDADPAFRGWVALGLGHAGVAGEQAIPALAAALRDKNSEACNPAGRALGMLGPKSLPALLDALMEARKENRVGQLTAAAGGLRVLGPAAEPAIPDLLDAFRMDYAPPEISKALAAIGPAALPALLKMLDTEPKGSGIVRRDVVLAISELQGGQVIAIPVLISALEEYVYSVRMAAASSLTKHRPDSQVAYSALLDLVKDSNAEARIAALDALGYLEPDPRALPVLQKAFNDANPRVSRVALFRLERFGPQTKEMLPALIAILEGKLSVKSGSGSLDEQGSALRTVAAMGSNAQAAIPALKKLLYEPKGTFADNAALALAAIGPDALPVLLEALQDKNTRIKYAAMSGLQRHIATVKTGEEPNFRALLNALTTAEVPLRDDLIPALATLNAKVRIPPNPKVLAAFQSALKSSSPKSGFSAMYCRVLGRMGPAASPAIPLLVEKLQDAAAARDALMALGQIGPKAVPALMEIVKGKDAMLRRFALEQLQMLGPAAQEAMPVVLEVLADPDGRMRYYAASALGAITTDAKVLPPLLKALADPDIQFRRRAAATIAELKPAPLTAASKLLQDADPLVRQSACWVLGDLGPAAKDAVPALQQALKDDVKEVRGLAVAALGKIGPAAHAALPALRELAKDEDSPVRFEAIRAIGQLGNAATVAVPDLIDMLKTGSTQPWAMSALGSLGPVAQEAVPALVEMLQADPSQVEDILRVLGQIGPKADTALAAVEKLLHGNDATRRRLATQTIVKIGPGAVPALQRQLADERLAARYEAALLLGLIGADAKSAIPALQQALEDKNSIVPAVAAWALGKIGPESKEILTKALKHPQPMVRYHAALGVGQLGAEAKSSLVALQTLREDKNLAVRVATGEAIRQLTVSPVP